MGLSLAAAGLVPMPALAAPFGSPAWFAQRGSTSMPAVAGQSGTTAAPGLVVTPDQALVRAQRSIQDLSRAADAIATAQQAQSAARQLAIGGASTVPDGLVAGGLVPDSGLRSAGQANPTTSWQNAGAPTQATVGDQTTVTVQQTAQKAILNWDTFNIGRNTTLDFDQHAGTAADGSNNWVALNRVTGTSVSQIQGRIKADGSVYLMNQNGIIFGGSSQVNVHTLVASSLSLFSTDVAASNAQFLDSGIAGTTSTLVLDKNAALPGDIRIEPGATISTGDLGFSLIAAPNVTNAGTIVAHDGQAILAAGIGVSLTKIPDPSSADATLPVYLSGSITGTAADPNTGKAVDLTPESQLVNTGVIEAQRGNVTLLGYAVTQGPGGVVAATTSVTRPGSIVMSAEDESAGGPTTTSNAKGRAGPLTLSENSVTAVLPEEDGETTTSSAAATQQFKAGSVSLTGGAVTLDGGAPSAGALVEAPGANVTVAAIADSTFTRAADDPTVAGRIYVDDGATIDVAGLANIELPMSVNLVTIPRLGQNELADSPLQRDGILYTAPITVDARDSGTRSDGLSWVGTPIADVEGYIESRPRTIDQLLTSGGNISLGGGDVITRSGSSLNLDGGYIHYLGGRIQTTRLLGADGRVYDIGSADPNMTYVGLAGQYIDSAPRWNVTTTYTDPLLSGAGGYESDYIDGGNGGALKIYVGGSAVLDGTLSAAAMAGRHQVDAGVRTKLPGGGSFAIGDVGLDALAYPSGSSGLKPPSPSFVVQDRSFDLGPGFNATTALPERSSGDPADTGNLGYWTPLPASAIEQGGFASVSATSNVGEIGVGADGVASKGLTVQPGGSIDLAAAQISVWSDLTARSGSISLTSTGNTSNQQYTSVVNGARGDIVIGPGVTLSARGQWVNDYGLTQDQQSGGAYLDGGNVSLTTLAVSGSAAAPDTTGSIVLDRGSLLDVSSGGRVLADGTLAAGHGIPLGSGGSISLRTYAGSEWQLQTPPPDALPDGGTIQAEGALRDHLRAFGFAGGGTLSLQAPGIQIGGNFTNVPDYVLKLPANFFSAQGFGAYDLTALYDATIADGVTVAPHHATLQANESMLLQAPTGADLFAADAAHPQGIYASPGDSELETYYGKPTDFSVRAGGYLTWNANLDNPLATTFKPPAYDGITGTLLLGAGASIAADPGATVTLASYNQVTVLGDIDARGGTIHLTGDTTQYGCLPPPVDIVGHEYSSASKSVWLGADSVLDVSGIALLDPLRTPVQTAAGRVLPQTGKVLAGGTITITDDNGYVIAEKGASVNASGDSATFDLPGDANTSLGMVYAPAPVWSDAGQITIGASSGLYFDGSFSAQAAGGGEGGSLTLAGLNKANSFIVQNAGDLLPGLSAQQSSMQPVAPGMDFTPLAGNTLYFSVDRLQNSGITSLTIGSDPNPPHPYTSAVPLTLGFSGTVNLPLGRAFVADAANYVALPSGTTAIPTLGPVVSTGDASVRITAPYVQLAGYYGNTTAAASRFKPVQTLGDGALQVIAQAIDLSGTFGLDNFAAAMLVSSGDIRFSTPAEYAYSPFSSSSLPGELFTSGNLTFKAAQLYPTTANTFIVKAVAAVDPATNQAAATTITVEQNGTSAVPLSAGGSLLIDADAIEQKGTLRAPSGSIVLGAADPSDPATRAAFGGADQPLTATGSVVLHGGSVTSVSLDNAIVPYGLTIDGKEWQYQGNPNTNIVAADLTAPPEKLIAINAESVSLNTGATVDLSGGGDLQAQEWIPGTGGSRDVLSAMNTVYSSGASPTQVPLYADGRPVYAIMPGYADVLSPYDPVLDRGQGGMQVGRSVYLSGVAGLPAGVYTLLPAKYATLPGAFRLVQQTSSIDALASGNATLPDGTGLVSGYFIDPLSGARTARTTTFDVQSESAWQQYSQYALSSADTYFPDQAAHAGTATPRLPVDAGQLVLAAGDQLKLAATLDSAAGNGGAGSEVDIAAQAVAITGGAGSVQNSAADVLQLNAASLDALGAGSLLIGGTRSQTATGVSIDAVASSVEVSNDAASVLRGPEIMLVANGSGAGVRVDAGSVIQATGSLPASDDVPITIGRAADAATGTSAVVGDGALLRVSNGAAVTIARVNVPGLDGAAGAPQGTLRIDANATIGAGTSVTLDASGHTIVDPTANFSAKSILADSDLITFVSSDAAGGANSAAGLVIGPNTLQQFQGADRIALRSTGSIAFQGDVGFDLQSSALTLSAGVFAGDGGAVSLGAATLTLSNDLNAPAQVSTTGSGSLTLNAGEIDFGAGDKSLTGFASVVANAEGGIVGKGSGGFDFGALPVSLHAPVVVADQGSAITLTTTGALSLDRQNAGTALTLAPLGGSLALVGGSVDVDTRVQALAGAVSIEAASGDLSLSPSAAINVQGVARQFFDQTRYAQGGTIRLTADQGQVVVPAGAVLDFAADARGGDAGSLAITAGQGAQLAGTLQGGAANGFLGGSFSLDSGAAVDLNGIADLLGASGVDDLVAVHSRAGDLSLSAGKTITAGTVDLTADGGDGGRDASQGKVTILGTIDASGGAGGNIDLYGKSGVDIEGSLLATGSAPDQRGGDVVIGTSGVANGTVNATYGYENVAADTAGTITLGSSAVIDVHSAGTAGGLSGGTVLLRAPLLDDGSVNVVPDGHTESQIIGARDVSLEAYATWNTQDSSTGAQHFDGLVDPAGWYDGSGHLVPGTFRAQDGSSFKITVPTDPSTLSDELDNDFFTPTAVNASHKNFYQATLAGFVENPGPDLSAGGALAGLAAIPVFHLRPGIDLVNNGAAVNNGDISVLTNWNLAARTTAGNGSVNLTYRYQGSVAPVLTLQAARDVNIEASLSDGFVQTNSPFSTSVLPDNTASPVANSKNPFPLLSAELDPLSAADSTSYRIVAGADFSSTDPLASLPSSAIAGGTEAGHGSVNIDGHTTATNKKDALELVAPTMIRTGTGSIEIAAADDIRLLDTLAPGVIYAAGTPTSTANPGSSRLLTSGSSTADLIVTGAVNPYGGGDVSLKAGNDILGVEQVFDTTGAVTGTACDTVTQCNYLGQFWWPWMQTGNVNNPADGTVTSSSINFGAFDQGVMSIGGNVAIASGGDVRDLAVSLPTTWYSTGTNASGDPTAVTTAGGGNLTVTAGGDLLSGDYFVAKGYGRISVAGRIGSDFTYTLSDGSGNAILSTPVSTLLALQDSVLTVSARDGADIGGIYNPSYYLDAVITDINSLNVNLPSPNVDSQSYTSRSSVSVMSVSGDVALDSLIAPQPLFSYGAQSSIDYSIPNAAQLQGIEVLPATLDLSALGGGLSIESSGELYPSSTGQLSLVADQSIRMFNANKSYLDTEFGMIDADPATLPSPTNPIADGVQDFLDQTQASNNFLYHQQEPLHASDTLPAIIYSLSGDIVDGRIGAQGLSVNPLVVSVDKAALIHAGNDIANLSFRGQNLYASDVTVIVAGHDLYDTALPQYDFASSSFSPLLQLAGPGSFDVEAGRDIGPLTSANEASAKGYGGQDFYTGLITVGNQFNPYLPRAGADIAVLFGVAPGEDLSGFASRYIDPASTAAADAGSYSQQLVQFVTQYDDDQRARSGQSGVLADLTPDQAWLQLQQLPAYQQQSFADAVFFDVLKRTGADYNQPSSPYYHQYARGYAAIEALFPAELGYTANDQSGGINGATTSVSTGNLDMRGSTIQSQQGGDISILGPGGGVLVGSTSAPPFSVDSQGNIVVGPNQQGILTLEAGNIGVFTNQSILLAQSRVFTEQGGSITMWSSNGDVNAGKGAKTTSEIPPLAYLCDSDHYCRVDAKGEVTGAGIATLQSNPDAASGDATLVAPHGTVDAGDAGIRVSGNLTIAALHVANADNIQVQGAQVGVPASAVNTGALSLANSAAAAAEQSASTLANARPADNAASMITVEVLGFGTPDPEQKKRLDKSGT